MDALFERSRYGGFMATGKKIRKAMKYCEKKHKLQFRKLGDAPYSTHLFGVAAVLGQYTIDRDVIIAGLLHDLLEDVKGVTAEDIRKRFGARVANIVKEVSEVKDPSKPSGKEDWLPRKKGYLEHLEVASREALLVSAADKIDNLNAIIKEYGKGGNDIWGAFNAAPPWIRWYNRRVLMILHDRLGGRITKEFNAVFNEADSKLGWKSCVKTSNPASPKSDKAAVKLDKSDKWYDCWGVPAKVWFDEGLELFIGGFYDREADKYLTNGSIKTIIRDGFEISTNDSVKLVADYKQRVFIKQYHDSVFTIAEMKRLRRG